MTQTEDAGNAAAEAKADADEKGNSDVCTSVGRNSPFLYHYLYRL